MKLQFQRESWPLTESFSISRTTYTAASVIAVELHAEGKTGRSECFPNGRFGETQDSVESDLLEFANRIPKDLNHETLLSSMPPCAARNAVDCALWDLDVRMSGRSVWDLLDIPPARSISTVFTIGLGAPEEMAQRARAATAFSTLKLKLSGDEDDHRIAAVAEAVPDKRFVVDANEAWSENHVREFLPLMPRFRVDMVEQPLPCGNDGFLSEVEHVVPICADESCKSSIDIANLIGNYEMINIKLDKCGGLTEGLKLAAEARRQGLQVMLGCNTSTSLGIAPALVLCGLARVVDLDAPLFLKHDRPLGLCYEGDKIMPTSTGLWGAYQD